LKKLNLTLTALVLFLNFGCSSLILKSDVNEGKQHRTPDFEDSHSYYFLGFSGQGQIPLQGVCGDKELQQIESLFTLEDGLIAVFTLGIYTPKSFRVWCKHN